MCHRAAIPKICTDIHRGRRRAARGARPRRSRCNLRVLDIRQGDSRFVGFDARGSFRLGGQVWATLGLGYVDATLTTTGEPLPRIPPLRGTLSLDIPFGGLTISPELLFAGRQDRIFRGETETRGYSVVNVDASFVWPRQHVAHVLSFTGYNLANALYRNHTSFIKDLALRWAAGSGWATRCVSLMPADVPTVHAPILGEAEAPVGIGGPGDGQGVTRCGSS